MECSSSLNCFLLLLLLLVSNYGYLTRVSCEDTDPLSITSRALTPQFTNCGKSSLPNGSRILNCCPPPPTEFVDFKLRPEDAQRLRVRQPIHLVNQSYIEKYERAVAAMKALPKDDPRTFYQQADVHCAYCNGGYPQVGFPNKLFEIHRGWLFYPFHRWMIYFHEKILGNLIGDPTFALPYWPWDYPETMHIPPMFLNTSSPFYDKLRHHLHIIPQTVVDLDYSLVEKNLTHEEQVAHNLKVMYRQAVSPKNRELFLGSPYRAGDKPEPGIGTVESCPHNTVHSWVGDGNKPFRENMGSFYSAARDPIFYPHHANIDRIWNVWKGLGGYRFNYEDPDWLDSSFFFYDENAQLVRVKVRDCLDEKKLGYVYQEIDIPWLNTKPTPANKPKKISPRTLIPSSKFPLTLNATVSTLVSRPKKLRTKEEKEYEEEILIIENIEYDANSPLKFDVYINDDGENTGPDKTEFAGTFVSVPHGCMHAKLMKKTRMKLGITELLEDLDAADDKSIVVTLVPRYGHGQITIGAVKIDFLNSIMTSAEFI